MTAVSRDGQHTTATVTYTVMLSDNRFSVRHLRIYRNGTVEFDVTVPYAGQLGVLETSWKPSPPRALHTVLLRPGSRCYAFARRHLNLARTGTLHVKITPGAPLAEWRAPAVSPRRPQLLLHLTALGEPIPGVSQPSALALDPEDVTRRGP